MRRVRTSRRKFDIQLPKHDYVGVSFHDNNPFHGFEYLILGNIYYDCLSTLTSGEFQKILIDAEAEIDFLEDQEEWKENCDGLGYSQFSSVREIPDQLYTLASILNKDVKVFDSSDGKYLATELRISYNIEPGEVETIKIQEGLNRLGRHSKLTKSTIEDFLK